ncbi:MAG: hypothetical protein RL543_14, partial [Pseudomonadota bacterium]
LLDGRKMAVTVPDSLSIGGDQASITMLAHRIGIFADGHRLNPAAKEA